MLPNQLKKIPVLLLTVVFTACNTNTVKDIDGNKYKTIEIGTQVWFAENLKTTRYKDGTSIEQVKKYKAWAALNTPAYCWYNNDSTNKEVYGALYNWYAVNTNKLCPEGWHVPTDEEWKAMQDFLGDDANAGLALKEAGITHWRKPNTDANNSSGFTALPGGYRDYQGPFNLLRADGFWWTSSESTWYSAGGTPSLAFYRNLRYDDNSIARSASPKTFGFCVRCIMDE